MEGFTEKDTQNLQLAKDAIGEKAAQGDVAAAAAFAALIDAQTRREELMVKTAATDRAPAAAPDSRWQETVTAGRQAEPEASLAA